MVRGGKKGEGGKGRDGNKGRRGRGGGPLCGKGWKGEGRKGRERTGIKEGEGVNWGRFTARGERGGQERKGRRNGELTLTSEP